MNRWILTSGRMTAALLLGGILSGRAAGTPEHPGKPIYHNLCANCHGEMGEGVPGEYKKPLIGNRSVEELKKIIHDTMPDEHPEKCVDNDAYLVATYIYDAFYSTAAQIRNQPPRIDFARLTINQYANTVADLVGSFRWETSFGEEHGLQAEYYKKRNYNRNERAFERVDPAVDYQFGEGSPGEGIEAEEFSMQWEGSIVVKDTGDYEFCVRTENGFKLWVNDLGTPLIDGWVASGGKPDDHTATVKLLGGRAYPIKLDYFKFKDKTASVTLSWTPPHMVRSVIPTEVLYPKRAASTFVSNTPFPADDSSYGYARGNAISKAWDTATTYAAIETAEYVAENLRDLAGLRREDDETERARKLKDFCVRFAERAFRRPLEDATREVYIGRQFVEEPEAVTAVKRSLLLTLKSPRFLYPSLAEEPLDDYARASRLALYFWDSLPDERLRQAAAKGELATAKQVNDQAWRMLKDPRTHAKLQGFFHHWLRLDEAEDVSKDMNVFPDFDQALQADLRTSLDLFLEETVWSRESDYRQLLTADYMFMSPRLAKFYGVEEPKVEAFQKVAFEPGRRSGVLTHPYLLSAFAYSQSSSPIHRGVFLTRNLLGRTLNPPPMNIEFMDGRFDASLTMREKVTELTKSAQCQTCHSIINPLGFSLESFDAVGRFRTEDKHKPVNTTSDFPLPTGDSVRLTGARDVAQLAIDSPSAHEGFIKNLFHNLVKQPVAAYGADTMERLHTSFVKSNFNIQQLMVEIVKVATLYEAPQPKDARND